MSTSELPTLTEEEIRARLDAELPAWTYDGAWLERRVQVDGWGRALLAAGGIAYLGEAAFHHPDLVVSRRRVRVQVRHHWAAGVTDADFDLARAVEELLAGAPAAPPSSRRDG